MQGYFSEIAYGSTGTADFIEVVLPHGVDYGAYRVVIYNSSGGALSSFSVGTWRSSAGNVEVFTLDKTNEASVPSLNANRAAALIGPDNEVLQFVSFDGMAITARDGAAAGSRSTSIGTAPQNQSLETTDGGQSYQAQSSPSMGTIPCYGPGTTIAAASGPRPVESLRPGDLMATADNGPQAIVWIQRRTQHFAPRPGAAAPVLIAAGALGPGRPARDLVVSAQHRILVGGAGQLASSFPAECLVPAKALAGLPGIRHMGGRRRIDWVHFACAGHQIIEANGCLSETLLPGPMLRASLSGTQLRLLDASGDAPHPARPCLRAAAARRELARLRPEFAPAAGPSAQGLPL